MPNRIIKESICTSDTLDTLSWFDEVVFYRLLVNCDDYGCFDARSAILKNRLFPLKEDGLSASTVLEAVNHLASVGLLTMYTVHGKPYLQMTTWKDHQRIRNSKRKYPWPEDADEEEMEEENGGEDVEGDVICDDSQKLAASCGETPPPCARAESNPIQSESNPNPNPNPNPKTPDAVKPLSVCCFDEFWAAYPKKKSKGDAEKAWAKLKPNNKTFEKIMASIAKQKKSKDWKKDNGQFIPYPATWLRAKGWEDEISEADSGGSSYDDNDLDFIPN